MRFSAKLPRALVVMAALATATPAAAERVVEVRIFENSKTTDDTVAYIAGVDKGDDINLEEDIPKIKERLVSSGLFKNVDVYTTPQGSGVRVNIEAKDKHSWAVAPTYYNQPTNKGFGFGFGENNLFGENKKLLLYGQLATGESFFLGALVDPQMWNSPFKAQLDVYLRNARIFEFESPTEWTQQTEKFRKTRMTYLNSGLSIGANLFRVGSFNARIRGARVSFKDTVRADDNEVELEDPGDEGWDVSGELRFRINTMANWYGVASGTRLTLRYERAIEALGSDFDYYIWGGGFVKAIRLLEKGNLIFRANAGYGKDLPFQQEFTSGGTGLRGYKANQFRGDFKVGGTTEFSFELINIKGVALRPVLFYDTAYTTFRDEGGGKRNFLANYQADGLTPWRNAVGGGFRIYIRQLVLPLLGIDYGYGLEAGEFEFFLAIGLTDL